MDEGESARGADTNSSDGDDGARGAWATQLCELCRNGDAQDVSKFLRQGNVHLNDQDADGDTALCVASSLGNGGVVGELLALGAAVDTPDARTKTPLFHATSGGHVAVVKLLLDSHASLDAVEWQNRTLLIAASSRGDVDMVGLLIAAGAAVDATDVDGDTALIKAASGGRIEVVKVLLANQANPNVVNAQGETAQMVASDHEHFEIMALLVDAGATYVVNAAWIHTQALLLFIDEKLVAHARTFNQLVELLPAALQVLRHNGSTTYEFFKIWDGVVDRLFACFVSFQDRKIGKFQFVRIMASLERLRRVHIVTGFFRRLATCRSILSRFRDIHTDIDQLQRASTELSERGDWCFTIRKQENAVFGAFKLVSRSRNKQQISYSMDKSEAADAVALLHYEINSHADMCRPKLLEVLELALDRLVQSNRIEVLSFPPWFLSTPELAFSQAKVSASGGEQIQQGLRRGKWLDCDVTLLQYAMPEENFVQAVEKWSVLSHPNVARLFGASHTCHPSVAVFEDISYSSLCEFVRAEKHHISLVWQKLYEAALGLKFLHERGIVLGALQLNSIWIGADGLAKIAPIDVNLFTSDSRDASEEEDTECWQSPEVLCGETLTFASNVYSFGKCVLAAVTGEYARSDLQQADVSFDRPSLDTREVQHLQGLSIVHQQLVDEMCSHDPLQRASLLRVIEFLKQFAEDSCRANSTFEQFAGREDEASGSALQEFRFPKLFSTTIKEFLGNLKRKLAIMGEPGELHVDHARHILARLDEIYTRSVRTGVSPHDPALMRLCAVAMKFRWIFFRFAISEGSVKRYGRSRQAAMHNDVFHRAIDQILSVLPMPSGEVNSIHDWELHECVDDQSDSGLEVESPTSELQGDELDDEAVQLVFKDPDTGNPRFSFISVDVERRNGGLATKHRAEEWRIQLDEIKYEAEDNIGSGGFAQVFRGKWLAAPVVIKLLGFEALSGNYEMELFLHELRVWKPLNHPHILKLYAACFSGKRFFVCEDAKHGTLLEYLGKGDNKSKVWHKLYDAAIGLQYLHSQNVAHNDLKCDNLLVGADEKTKIADFGLACILNSVEVLIATKKQGAVWWRSPEYLRGERVTLASDIYSFGMCILEAVTGGVPRKSLDTPAVRYQVLRGRLPLRPDGMSDSQWSLVEAMLFFDPAGRPQILSVVSNLRVIAQDDFTMTSVACPTPGPLQRVEHQLNLTSTRGTWVEGQTSPSLPVPRGHSNEHAAALPQWLLQCHEFASVKVVRSEQIQQGLRRGKWLDCDVTLLQYAMPEENFVQAVEKWSVLSHPNVARLFGASHTCHPSVAVFEDISYSSLCEFVRAEKHHISLVWQKLYEAALGLKFLHERGIVLGALQLNSIWIGADGLAKIAPIDVNLFTSDSRDASEEEDTECWQSPEVLCGETLTFASNVYSFGKCVLAAVTGEYARSDLQQADVSFDRPSLDTREVQHLQGLSIVHQQLVDEMCSHDPLQRASLLRVIEFLKQFAEQCSQEISVLSQSVNVVAKLRTFLPPELDGSTIEQFLALLKRRLVHCKEFSVAISHVLARLADISSHLYTTDTSPQHVAVKKFCRVLRDVGRFLNISIGLEASAVRTRRHLSRNVSSDNNLHHKQIDEVMDLLPGMLVNDRIHNWEGLSKTDPKVTYSENGITLTECAPRSVNTKLNTSGLNLNDKMQAPWLIRLHEIEFDEGDRLSRGSFSEIYQGHWLGSHVVIKQYGYEEDAGALSQKLFSHELRVWYPLNHPHIIKLFGAFPRDNRFIVFEYAGHGDLLGFLKRDSNRSKTWQKLHEIALGLQYLHELNVIHNHLLCAHFLIGTDEKAKISDFELSSVLNSSEVLIDPKSQGAVHWKSPEYLRGERSTPESDIYSFGMCILEAVTGTIPWGNTIPAVIRFSVLRKRELPLRPESMTGSQWNLIQMMCASDPLKRVTIAAVVDRLHDFAQEEEMASRSINCLTSEPQPRAVRMDDAIHVFRFPSPSTPAFP